MVVRQKVTSQRRSRSRNGVAGDGNNGGVEVWSANLDGDVATNGGVSRAEGERVDGSDDKGRIGRRAALDEGGCEVDVR